MSRITLAILPTPPTSLKLEIGKLGIYSFTINNLAAPDTFQEVILQGLWVVADGKQQRADWLIAETETLTLVGGKSETASIKVQPNAKTPLGANSLVLAIADREKLNDEVVYSAPVICEVVAAPAVTAATAPTKRGWLLPAIIAAVLLLGGGAIAVWKLATLPAGMIAMFAAVCPSGWTEYTKLRGRFPRGELSGDPASLDLGGTDDAVVVAHGHGVSLTTGSDGSHSHNQNTTANFGACPGSGINRTNFNADGGGACQYGAAGTTDAGGAHTHVVNGATSSTGVSGAGLNVPSYAEVIYCVKQ